MTPGARIAAAIEILERVAAGEPAEKVLTTWARRNRFAGSGDRAAIRDHVFDALRCWRSFAALGGSTTGRGLMIGALRDRGDDPAEFFTAEGYAPAALTPSEAEIPPVPSGAAELDLQDWQFDLLEQSLGAQAREVALALRRRADVFLRVNIARTDLPRARAWLSSCGIEAVPDPICATALRVGAGARRISTSPPYLEGHVELQDGASQAVVARLPLHPGMRVLDYCAGGGGKTLAMAARLGGRVFAHDADPGRMKDLAPRAARAGAEVTILGTAALEREAPFDLVLCDVPCSGSGAWRRAPEGKWTLSPAALADIGQIQDDILDHAATLVAADGVLAYATCSLFAVENAGRIARFLSRQPGWRLSWSRQWVPPEGGDGFYCAHLIR